MTNRRALVSLLPLWLASPLGLAQGVAASAPPAARKYVVMSLVGDKLTYVNKTGGSSDALQRRNEVSEVPMPGAPHDMTALQTIAAALPQSDPGATMRFLAGSSPDFYKDQDAWFDGDAVKLPDKLRAAVAAEHAARLLLLTKRRAEARIPDGQASVGGGKLEGLGFFTYARRDGLVNRDTAAQAHACIAPYVYARLTLIDLASLAVVRHHVIESATPYPELSVQAQLGALEEQLVASLKDAVPRVIAAA